MRALRPSFKVLGRKEIQVQRMFQRMVGQGEQKTMTLQGAIVIGLLVSLLVFNIIMVVIDCKDNEEDKKENKNNGKSQH